MTAEIRGIAARERKVRLHDGGEIALLGGSNAQRDLFTRMLVDAAMRAGGRDIAGEIIAHEAATRAVPARPDHGLRVLAPRRDGNSAMRSRVCRTSRFALI